MRNQTSPNSLFGMDKDCQPNLLVHLGNDVIRLFMSIWLPQSIARTLLDFHVSDMKAVHTRPNPHADPCSICFPAVEILPGISIDPTDKERTIGSAHLSTTCSLLMAGRIMGFIFRQTDDSYPSLRGLYEQISEIFPLSP